MWNSADDEILAAAAERGAIVVTLDADFHAILAVSGYSKPSVIRLRLEGLRAGAVVDIVKRVLAAFASDLVAGSLITVKARKTTCRRLPIGFSGLSAAQKSPRLAPGGFVQFANNALIALP